MIGCYCAGDVFDTRTAHSHDSDCWCGVGGVRGGGKGG